MATLYEQGLETIDGELKSAFNQAGISNIRIDHTTRGSALTEVVFSISAQGRTEELVFTREEIEDSGLAIDFSAATKVRLLVSRLIGDMSGS
jgi:hypothetical protein